MSAEFAIALSLLVFASNYACYRLGQQNMEIRMKRRRERKARWEEFDDQD